MRCTMIPAVIALVASVAAALAAPATIEGSWRGSGIVTYGNGADNVQCRVRYTRATVKSFAVSSPCANESGHYELTGRVINVGAIATPAGCRARSRTKAAGLSSSSAATALRSPSRADGDRPD